MNCKPGDLAYVVGAVQTPEMIGHVVSVLRLVERHETPNGLRICNWHPSMWLVEGISLIPLRSTKGVFSLVKYRVVSDSNLRPISGVPLADDVTNEEKVSA